MSVSSVCKMKPVFVLVSLRNNGFKMSSSRCVAINIHSGLAVRDGQGLPPPLQDLKQTLETFAKTPLPSDFHDFHKKMIAIMTGSSLQ